VKRLLAICRAATHQFFYKIEADVFVLFAPEPAF